MKNPNLFQRAFEDMNFDKVESLGLDKQKPLMRSTHTNFSSRINEHRLSVGASRRNLNMSALIGSPAE